MFRHLVFLSLFFATFLATRRATGKTLIPNEVETLKEIGSTLGKNWDFNVDPCSGESGWTSPKDSVTGFESEVVCDNCTLSSNTTNAIPVCHVVRIILKSQNLSGTLPKSLVNLPYLKEFDVTRNFLNGSIPPEWGSTNLEILSVMANRLTGPIPKEIGNISTLTSLNVEINKLSGVLPGELGTFPRIDRMLLTSNYFTGELNESFGGLTSLTDFRIGDNSFTGKIPNFITKLTNLTKLIIQASGMSGPIPSDIGSLQKMEDLRITDINGAGSPFPQIDTMINLETLMLRSCNITGKLPGFLGQMTNLSTIDLSFNKLQGEIPNTYENLRGVDRIYLTGNSLSGPIPKWILTLGRNIDLSYNKFDDPEVGTCQQRAVNLFQSSSKSNTSGVLCLRTDDVCPKQLSYSFHINCGGKTVDENGITYVEDSSGGGSSTFYERSSSYWAYSSTGYYPDDSIDSDSYTSTTSLPIESQLYTDARLSPLSLTYYGFCMVNGKYIVELHFAEISFIDGNSYYSLGRRIFDVYIQGKLVLKDFNIEEAAGGTGKKIIITNTTIVTDNSLEIRFYWAGKGTNAIPSRGVYGPLVSAISVINPDYEPPKPGGISAGAVVGIVAGVAVFLLVLGIVLWRRFLRREDLDDELRGLDLQTGLFTLRQIKAATNNFDNANKIGEGGFGSVYKGLLSDGKVIAVKQLSAKSKQGNREFVNEIGMISALQHIHLVKLYGCCIEGNQLLLIYEYMENNCLARALFGPKETQLNLDWPTRHKICVGIARGLAYLHEESRLKIVHRDIKATNVLLDKNLDAKISDFGLAKLDEEDNTHISTRIAGTYGYMAPEYAMRGYLTDKADVYSFGIVALEIVSGRGNTSFKSKDNPFYLLDWALVLKQEGREMELVDPKLGNDYNKKEMKAMINIALLCTNVSPAVRPIMSSVVSMLEGKAIVTQVASDPSHFYSEMNYKPMENQYQHSQEQSLIKSEVHSDGPWTGSSISAADLYPIQPNSDYWQSRT